MSQNIYDDVNSVEELKRGQRVEVEVVIYESADTVRRHDPNTEMEATNSKRKAEIHNTDSTSNKPWNSILTRLLSFGQVLLDPFGALRQPNSVRVWNPFPFGIINSNGPDSSCQVS
ncbi:hypothetical protein SRHO_G00250170 [Serrasalmus rhombeus]